ncbi:hypothetical protein K505DRAFT_388763, partial [Melanomma pulvis-pyrius CBS 109.77]
LLRNHLHNLAAVTAPVIVAIRTALVDCVVASLQAAGAAVPPISDALGAGCRRGIVSAVSMTKSSRGRGTSVEEFEVRGRERAGVVWRARRKGREEVYARGLQHDVRRGAGGRGGCWREVGRCRDQRRTAGEVEALGMSSPGFGCRAGVLVPGHGGDGGGVGGKGRCGRGLAFQVGVKGVISKVQCASAALEVKDEDECEERRGKCAAPLFIELRDLKDAFLCYSAMP